MVIAPADLIVAILGVVLYFGPTNPKLAELGRIMIFAGLLALLLAQGSHVVRVG